MHSSVLSCRYTFQSFPLSIKDFVAETRVSPGERGKINHCHQRPVALDLVGTGSFPILRENFLLYACQSFIWSKGLSIGATVTDALPIDINNPQRIATMKRKRRASRVYLTYYPNHESAYE